MKYKEAQDYFERHEFKAAFAIFKEIAESETYDARVRSDAYNMMGVIIGGFLDLDWDDESGLKYFKMAIALNPDNEGALFNIAESFGEYPSMHQDNLAFNEALRKLKGRNDLSPDEIERLVKLTGKLGKGN